jgi:two-component system nitrogen regulation response regulator GlnG
MISMSKLLVVDDEPSILHAFRRVFGSRDITLLTSTSATDGIALARAEVPDVIILDVHLPDLPGLDAFQRIREFAPKVPVIFITGHGTTEIAIEATKLGAFDYLFKPLELTELRQLVSKALDLSRKVRIAPDIKELSGEEPERDVIIGRCSAMKEVYQAIGRVASQDVTVLLLGESGTGKELIARAIYHHSSRVAGPFLAVNCAAIPETLLESELFGHEKGAFTGAERTRIGKFEQANGGTLFLDEIGDMTPLTQAKVLRVLQDQSFQRVGSNETITANARVIAATHRNLDRMVQEKEFRADLFYRLCVFTLRLPALRERLDDLPELTEYLVRRYARELGKHIQQVDPDVHRLLRHHDWPGNIRELQSVLKQALLCESGHVLTSDSLPVGFKGPGKATMPSPIDAAPSGDWEQFVDEQLQSRTRELYAHWQSLTDRYLLKRVLNHTKGNLSRAADLLGISRKTLREKLDSLGMRDP